MDFFDNCIYFDLHGISFVPMVLWLLEKPSATYRQNCKPYQSNLLVHICMMYLRLHSNGMGKCNIKSICEMNVNLENKLTSIVVLNIFKRFEWKTFAALSQYNNTKKCKCYHIQYLIPRCFNTTTPKRYWIFDEMNVFLELKP